MLKKRKRKMKKKRMTRKKRARRRSRCASKVVPWLVDAF
jgi:hypothetical protein